MLDIETLNSLDLSDKVEIGPLISGLTQEPVQLVVIGKTSVGDCPDVMFEASYHGIGLGVWTAKIFDNKVTWTGLPT